MVGITRSKVYFSINVCFSSKIILDKSCTNHRCSVSGWGRQTTTWDLKDSVNNEINYQPHLVSRISSINRMTLILNLFWFQVLHWLSSELDTSCLLQRFDGGDSYEVIIFGGTDEAWIKDSIMNQPWFHYITGWCNSNISYFHPYLGKISNLTNIFRGGLAPPTRMISLNVPYYVSICEKSAAHECHLQHSSTLQRCDGFFDDPIPRCSPDPVMNR